MFVLKTTVAKIQARNAADTAELRALYEARIAELHARIEDLKLLVFPTQVKEVSHESRELDAIISASEKSPMMSEEEMNRILEGQREMDLLLAGTYDTELVN